MNVARFAMIAGAWFGGVAVAAGAFGAHALKHRLTPDLLVIFETAVRYQMYHALALLALGVMGGRTSSPWLDAAGWCFVIGTAVFSGSLYVLALTGVKAWGAVTPVGGLLLILGWAALGVGVMKP